VSSSPAAQLFSTAAAGLCISAPDSDGSVKIDVIGYERQNLLSGSGATEAPHFLALLKQYHCGKASHPIVPGQFHVIPSIHLELGKTNGTVQVCHDVRQNGGYDETG
jgi:hypothetical protein